MDIPEHHPRRTPRAAAGAALLVAFAVGCGDGGGGGGTPPSDEQPPSSDVASEQIVIVISDFAYAVPDAVPPGSELVVRNEDGVGHTVTSDEDGGFDVVVPAGDEVTLTVPDEAGEYPFHCTPHPAMTATLVVG